MFRRFENVSIRVAGQTTHWARLDIADDETLDQAGRQAILQQFVEFYDRSTWMRWGGWLEDCVGIALCRGEFDPFRAGFEVGQVYHLSGPLLARQVVPDGRVCIVVGYVHEERMTVTSIDRRLIAGQWVSKLVLTPNVLPVRAALAEPHGA